MINVQQLQEDVDAIVDAWSANDGTTLPNLGYYVAMLLGQPEQRIVDHPEWWAAMAEMNNGADVAEMLFAFVMTWRAAPGWTPNDSVRVNGAH